MERYVLLVNDAAITDIVVTHLSLEPTVHAVLDSRFWSARGLSNDFLTGTFLRCGDDRATGPIAMSGSGAMIELRDIENRLKISTPLVARKSTPCLSSPSESCVLMQSRCPRIKVTSRCRCVIALIRTPEKVV